MPVLTTDEAALHYEVAGEGEPLLLLHGLGSSTLDWQLTMERFAPRYRVIALDFRGSGDSRDLRHPSGPFRVRQFSGDVKALLEHLGAAPAHIVGLSLGGAVAFDVAVRAPELVRTLTIVNSAPSLRMPGAAAQVVIALRRVVARVFGPRGMARMLAPKLFPNPEHEALRRTFIERMARNKRGAYIATQLAALGWSVREQIGGIAAPTLVIGAEHDYPFLADKQAWVREMQRAEYVEIPGTHHALPVEAPEAFHAALAPFLARHTAGSAG
ncbi:MAG: alpha/beta fold hydrolase [Gemmatimonadetes bacterium]|nr:alpha/beta fold hydrolase [Gemmatimonadota bacterium]